MEIEEFYKKQLSIISELEKLGYKYFDFQDNTRGRKFRNDKNEIIITIPSFGGYTLSIEYAWKSSVYFLYTAELENYTEIQEHQNKILKIKELLTLNNQ